MPHISIKPYLIPFQNIKFNIGLFSALALASVLGTLIPQFQENPDKVQEFIKHSPKLGTLFEKLSLFNIYYSWWFIGLLGLLAFDVIVCKLIFGKFPGLATFKKQDQSLTKVHSQPFKITWHSHQPPEQLSDKIIKILEKQRYHITKIKQNSRHQIILLAAKHRLQRFGSWISHVSILLILLANLTGALYGFREVLHIPEGTRLPMQNRPWTVACDQFTVDWYGNTNTPKTFASQIRLFDNEKLVENKRILVNEPLEYKKTRFYQATYGPYLKKARIGFFLRKTPKKSPTVEVHLDEDVSVPGTPYSLRILQFIPDFSMDENRKISSRSAQPNNPALQILVSKNGKPLKAPWVFENYPMLQMPPPQQEDEFILILANYVPSYYTGLQIAYDPGADLFWIACTILVLGLMTLFYLHHRKIWVVIKKEEHSKETDLHIGAFSSRGKSFELEFQELVSQLQRTTKLSF
jgi:cytochrome c biogenesis protein